MKKIVKKQSLSKTLLCGIAIWAASFAAVSVQAQTYNVGDIAVINNIIANNGLNWTPANPADGSYIPSNWVSCFWTSGASNKRITILDIHNKSLNGMLNVSGLENLQDLSCGFNQLTDINVSGLGNLQTLSCPNNQLTTLNVLGLKNLRGLNCQNNQLTKLDLSGLNLSIGFVGNNQSVSLTMVGNGTNYTAAILLNSPNPATFAAGVTYNSGTLTSTSNTIASSPFEVQTGLTGFTLSGKFNFTYLELYTVTFAGIEISIPSQPILEGGKVSKPADPIRAGYDFGGWFTDSGTFLKEWNFATDVVTQDTTLVAKWTEKTGISTITNDELRMTVFPNPTSGKIVFSGQLLDVSIKIYDIVGKMQESRISEIGQSEIILDISHLPSGIYFVKLKTDKGIVTQKIVKQ